MSALELKASGNEKFKAKEYANAEADYSEAINLCSSHDKSLKVTLLSNRSTCRASVGDVEGAKADARSGISLDPTYTKCYFRLAKLLMLSKDNLLFLEEACRLVCIAVALSRGNVDRALENLFQEVRTAMLSSSSSSLRLPASTTRVRLVTPGIRSIGGAFAFSGDSVVVCALPGRYTEAIRIDNVHKHHVLIGIGTVFIDQIPSSMNTLWAVSASSLYVSGINFTGGHTMSSQAAILLSHGGEAVLFDSNVVDYAGGGLLVCEEGTKAVLHRCSFKALPLMGIEVREGGSLVADRIDISGCKQGVVAYGGAKDIRVSNSAISNCSHEGMYLAGSFQNAATVMQMENQKVSRGEQKLTPAQSTAEDAVEWARTRGIQLCGSILETTVRRCGQFGLSIDFGAQICVYASTLLYNDPYGIFVKGGSDLSLAACRLDISNTESKSPFTLQQKAILSNVPRHLKPSMGKMLKQCGLTVGVNYNGDVLVSSCVTVGNDESSGIVEESSSMQSLLPSKLSGLYSKSPTLSDYAHYHPDDESIPSIGDLVSHLPLSWRSAQAPRNTVRSQPALRELRRPCRSHQDTSWSPTGMENYAIGNTAGYDMVADQKLPDSVTSLRVLFGASGDLRNLLWTVASNSLEVGFDVFLNDGNVAMLARNAVLLEMIASEAPAEHILSVWANHELTNEENGAMMAAISKLASSAWPGWLTASNVLDAGKIGGDGATEKQVRSVLEAWSTCNVSSASVLAERCSTLKAQGGMLLHRSLSLTEAAVGPKAYSKYRKEISDYINRGSLIPPQEAKRLARGKLNVTLLLPELQYTVYFSSSIFRAVVLDGSYHDSAHAALLHTLAPKFRILANALQLQRCNIVVHPSDILSGLTDNTGDVLFDFIDLSNVADYVSLPALLQAAAPRLKPVGHARLFVESLVMFRLDKVCRNTPRSFVEAMCGCDLPTMEQMIGLKLVERKRPPTLVGGNGLRMEFTHTFRDGIMDWVSLCTQLSSPATLDMYACVSAVKTWAPAAYASPVTLIHLLTTCAQPSISEVLVRTILRCGYATLRFYEWEIKSQAAFQLDVTGSNRFVRVKYTGIASSTMMLFSDHPVVIAVSKSPLSGTSVSLDQVLQLLSTCAFEAEMCSSEFLLLEDLVPDEGAELYFTLLFQGVAGLSVAASSEKLHGLVQQPIKSEASGRWRTNMNTREEGVDQAQLGQLNRLSSCARCKKISVCNTCARCHKKKYCSKLCQAQDWRKGGHRRECVAVEK